MKKPYNPKLKILFLLIFIAFNSKLNAQVAINTSYGNQVSETGEITYVVGQWVYSPFFNTDEKKEAQKIIKKSTSPASVLNLEFEIYPNPTSDNITISISDFNNVKLYYQLFNIEGKLLLQNEITDFKTILSLKPYESSMYFLQLIDQNNNISNQTKLIKN